MAAEAPVPARRAAIALARAIASSADIVCFVGGFVGMDWIGLD